MAVKNLSMIEMLEVLYPSRYASFDGNPNDGNQQRFSTLLLDHGEQELQDWGVVATSTSARSSPTRYASDSSSVGSTSFSSQLPKNSRSSSSLHRRPRKSKESGALMKRNIKGRLRLCSKSIVFEPNDLSRGIIRLPFDRMTITPKNDNSSSNGESKTITLQITRCTVMKKNNIIAPYEAVDKRISFTFTFLHSSTRVFLELFDKIYGVPSEKLQEIIKPMCDETFDASNFLNMNEVPVTSNLRSFMLGPFPLVKKAGCIIATEQRLYFQPFNGIQSSIATKALSWSLSDITAIARRYHGLKDEALEIFFEEGPSVLLAFEGYRNREEIIRLLPLKRRIAGREVPIICHTDRSFLIMVVNAWGRGEIDNFHYLLALNSAAGRSLFDLSRYPIFPWVLADYDSSNLELPTSDEMSNEINSKIFRDLTKPVGALNADRLEGFKERLRNMDGMDDDAFLYGTHYSCPGYCLYYLVRIMPEQMLCLQNGKYDAPDRLFHAIDQCYASVLSNPADIKESIPQFYDPKGGADFLLNLCGLQLGVTQNGTIINDVELPKWAKSPKDFLKKNRLALESSFCTNFLPAWIDLIFGQKARGQQALEANNLFHPTSYLTPKNVEEMASEVEKMQAEVQATEFGICPDVLFSSAHPMKGNIHNPNSWIAVDDERAMNRDAGGFDAGQDAQWQRISRPVLMETDRTLNTSLGTQRELGNLPKKMNLPIETSRQGEEEVNGVKDKHGSDGQNEDVIELNASDFGVKVDNSSGSNTNAISLRGSGESSRGHPTNGVGTFGSVERDLQTPSQKIPEATPALQEEPHTDEEWILKPVASKQMHGESVTGCYLSIGANSYVTTVALDGSLMVHMLPSAQTKESRRRGFSSSSQTGRYSNLKPSGSSSQGFHAFRSHQSSDPLACLAIVSDNSGGNVVFAGGHDDVVMAYGINSACGLASVYSHRDIVTGLVLVEQPKVAQTLATHVMISSSWDATVKLWNVTITEGERVEISKDPFAEFYDADSSVDCVDALYIPDIGLVLAAGCTDGGVIVWLWTTSGEKSILFKENAKRGDACCSAIKWSNNGDIILFAGFRNGAVSSYAFKHEGMYPVSKLTLGSSVQCLSSIESTHSFFVGCADGGLRLINTFDGGQIGHENPQLWKSVNGASSPGITSLSVISTVKENQKARYTIASGADDGSVSLYLIENLH